MRGFILGISLILLSFSLHAQHCPYDGSAMIMVELKLSEKLVQNYRVSLVMSDTIIDFWQDKPIFHTDKEKKSNWLAHHGEKSQFPFLKPYKDVYLIIFGVFGKRELLTQAEDNLKIRLFENAKTTDYQEFSVSIADVHNLCKNNQNLWTGTFSPKILELK